MEEKMQNNSKPSSGQDAEAESKDVLNMEEKMQNNSKPSSGQDAEAESKDVLNMEEKMQNNSKPSSGQDAEAESKDVPNMEEKMQNNSKPSSGQDAEAESKDVPNMEEKMQNNSKPSSGQDAEAESKDVPNMEEKMQNICKPSLGQDAEAKSKDIGSFHNSLQELRDLRSQLHYAADYCESTFLNTKEKKVAMENTKEYICRAVVTVVDHLGCVSTNLNGIVSETNAFSEAEIRIDCLKQRMFLCEQYTHKFALPRVRWREIIPRHNARFLSAATREAEKPNEDSRDIPRNPASHKTIDKQESDRDVAMPLFLYTSSHKPSLSKGENNSALAPVRDDLSILSRGPNLTFHFQEARKINGRLKKSGHGSDILSLIRRAKRAV